MDESVQELAYQELNNEHWNDYFETQAASREISDE